MMTRLAKTVVEPTAKNGFIFTLLGTKWGFLWLWLLIINVAAFLAYGLDKLLAKLKARHEKVPRLPERNLLLLAIVGGGIGAWLGMEVFRHKTQHRSFRVIVPLSCPCSPASGWSSSPARISISTCSADSLFI